MPYFPPPTIATTLAAADPTITVAGTPAARTVKVAKQLDSTYVTDFAAAVAAQLTALTSKQEVAYATDAALPANAYNNAGGTLTATANGALAVDGQNVAANQRILVKNEADATHNGVYVVTATGGAGAAYVLTRAADYDAPAEIGPGDLIPVAAPAAALGATNDQTLWVSTAPSPFVLGVSTLTFTRIGSGAVALSTDFKTLAADNGAALVNAWTTVLTSASLAIGTWLVTFDAQCAPQGAGSPTIQVAAGTATAAFHGPTVAQGEHDGVANNLPINLGVTTLVTVTVAGTLLFQTRDPNAAGGSIKSVATNGGFAGATGYTAVKIA